MFGPAEVFGDAGVDVAEIRRIKSTSFRLAPTAWSRIISARPCIPTRSFENFAVPSIHSWLPGSVGEMRYDADSWTGSRSERHGSSLWFHLHWRTGAG